MSSLNFIPSAIEIVLDWDLPDCAIGDAVNAQACLMSRDWD